MADDTFKKILSELGDLFRRAEAEMQRGQVVAKSNTALDKQNRDLQHALDETVARIQRGNEEVADLSRKTAQLQNDVGRLQQEKQSLHHDIAVAQTKVESVWTEAREAFTSIGSKMKKAG